MDITPIEDESVAKEGRPLVAEPRKKIEIGLDATPTLGEVTDRLVTLFDLKPAEEYVSTDIDSTKPFTPEELSKLTKFRKCEVIILSKTEANGKRNTRLISGYSNSCDIQELLPVKQVLPPLGEYDKPVTMLRHIYGHLEKQPDGSETIVPWEMEVHTHIGNDPYPSNRDLEGIDQRSRVCLIDSGSGITIYGAPPEKPANVPEGLRELFGDRSTKELIFDGKVINGIKEEIKRTLPDEIANDPKAIQVEFKRRACEIFGIPIRVIPWTDAESIRKLFTEIYENKYDPKNYFENE